MVTLYGISNCDSIRKARRWLDARGVDYRFHDYRKNGLERSRLESWVDQLGWEALLNRSGTNWRKLPEGQRDGIDRERAIALMLEHPAMIKRPLLISGEQQLIGFKEEQYADLFPSP